jgi:hypothetical protein
MWTGPTKNFFELTLTSEKKLDAWYFLGVCEEMGLSRKTRMAGQICQRHNSVEFNS